MGPDVSQLLYSCIHESKIIPQLKWLYKSPQYTTNEKIILKSYNKLQMKFKILK